MYYFALRLIEARLDRVGLLQALQRQDEQLGVVLVGERRERDGRKASRLEPVDSGGVDGDSLFGRDVRAVLQVVVLPLLLRFEEEAREAAQVLLADRLVDGGAAANALAVVVGCAGPPISFGL